MFCYNDINFFLIIVFLFLGYVNIVDINRIVKDFKIIYDVVCNGVFILYVIVMYFVNVILENIGNVLIFVVGWSIYFCYYIFI